MYPIFDSEYEEATIAKVSGDAAAGWSISRADGWSFFVPQSSPVTPAPGMAARFYGKGIGFAVRGLFIEGIQVFYRTAAEDDKHQAAELYGKDARDWLSRWDAGRSVWSIEMGGFGPGYEQALQIAVTEVLRYLLNGGAASVFLADGSPRGNAVTVIDEFAATSARINALGLSGAQWGAAIHLAVRMYRSGPQALMVDPAVKSRHIQICKNFPSVP